MYRGGIINASMYIQVLVYVFLFERYVAGLSALFSKRVAFKSLE